MKLRRKLSTIGAALAAALLTLTVGATAAGATQQNDTAPYYGGDRVSVPLCCGNTYDAASTGDRCTRSVRCQHVLGRLRRSA